MRAKLSSTAMVLSGLLVLAGASSPSVEPIRYEIRMYRSRQVRTPHLQKIWAAALGL